MGVFSGINEAKPAGGGVYVEPGVYDLEVIALKAGSARDGRQFFVAEFKTLKSNNPSRPVGCVQSWMVMLDRRYLETALGNIKTFLATLTNSEPHEIDEAGVEMAVAADNPMAGMKIAASFVNIKTKAGKDFTRPTWLAYTAA